MDDIRIVPFLFQEHQFLPHVADVIARDLERSVTIAEIDFDASYAFDPSRKQFNSTQILKGLLSMNGDSPKKILGITDVDLFIPILTHVYGEAQLGGKAAIVSTFRLKDDLKVFTTDAFKERIGGYASEVSF